MKCAILWTGGKDSCIALHEANAAGYTIAALVTFTPAQPVFLAHPIEVMQLQAEALGLPHIPLVVNEPFRESYAEQLRRLKNEDGISCVVSGDIDEVDGHASWMEACCADAGMELWRPLWKMERVAAIAKAKQHGLRFLLSCVKQPFFDAGWVGKIFDAAQLEELETAATEKGFDLCGENGEYHTIVLDALLFRSALQVSGGAPASKGELLYLSGAKWSLVAKKESRKKVAMAWSGGKDSSLALYRVLQQDYEVVSLFTTITAAFRRVTMHGVREELVDLQAKQAGIPLLKMFPGGSTNEAYEKALQEVFAQLKAQGVEAIVFGDIYLEDLRRYREQQLAAAGLEGIFPLWKNDPRALLDEFFSLGFRTMTCCIHAGVLEERHAGQELDAAFVQALPANVDPCGENGEFHTFCFAGPIFKAPLAIRTGEKLFQQLALSSSDPAANQHPGFWYCDLLPAE